MLSIKLQLRSSKWVLGRSSGWRNNKHSDSQSTHSRHIRPHAALRVCYVKLWYWGFWSCLSDLLVDRHFIHHALFLCESHRSAMICSRPLASIVSSSCGLTELEGDQRAAATELKSLMKATWKCPPSPMVVHAILWHIFKTCLQGCGGYKNNKKRLYAALQENR